MHCFRTEYSFNDYFVFLQNILLTYKKILHNIVMIIKSEIEKPRQTAMLLASSDFTLVWYEAAISMQ